MSEPDSRFRKLHGILTAVFLILCCGVVQAFPINIFNTGVDASGVIVPGGTVGDLHYSLISAPPDAVSTIKAETHASGFPFGIWSGDNTLSRWIGPNTQYLNGPAGNYIYRTTFDLGGLDPLTAVLNGLWATDDVGLDILINGASTGHTITYPGYTAFSSFTISNGFIAGVNTLDFVLTNLGGPTGLRVQVTGSANAAATVPEPATLGLLASGLFGLAFSRRRKV